MKITDEMVEAGAQALYARECDRSARVNSIFEAASGKVFDVIEPYDECADATWRPDARAVLEAALSADAITALEARAREAEEAKAEISTQWNRVQDLYFAAEARIRELEAAVLAEREACARVCEGASIAFDIEVWLHSTKKEMTTIMAQALAAAIRARTPEKADARDPLADLVSRFSAALLEKLRRSERKGRRGWDVPDWREDLLKRVRDHVEKGDPLDVAAFAAFAWYHGWSLSRARTAPAQPEGSAS